MEILPIYKQALMISLFVLVMMYAQGLVPFSVLFTTSFLRAEAYSDHPLPIGHGQTISQPYIVALMTEGLLLTGAEKTLELGTGSGYQAAILAELSDRVFTIERIKPLQDRAQKILKVLGYTNISFKY